MSTGSKIEFESRSKPDSERRKSRAGKAKAEKTWLHRQSADCPRKHENTALGQWKAMILLDAISSCLFYTRAPHLRCVECDQQNVNFLRLNSRRGNAPGLDTCHDFPSQKSPWVKSNLEAFRFHIGSWDQSHEVWLGLRFGQSVSPFIFVILSKSHQNWFAISFWFQSSWQSQVRMQLNCELSQSIMEMFVFSQAANNLQRPSQYIINSWILSLLLQLDSRHKVARALWSR